jgi:MFS family permease
MSLWTGSMFGLIPTGVITENLGWRWTFIIAGIFLAVFATALTLFVPETAYNRNVLYELDINGDEGIDTLNAKRAMAEESSITDTEQRAADPTIEYGPRKSWVQRMSLFNGRFSPENPLKMIARPWALAFLHLPIFWTMIFTGMSQVFSVGISYLIAQVYGVPPYNLNPAQLGYISAGPVVGVILGAAFSALSFDRVARYCARINNGIYEPEFRLFFAIPAIIFSGLGLYGFGIGISAGQGPIVSGMFYGFAIGGLLINMNTGFSYVCAFSLYDAKY